MTHVDDPMASRAHLPGRRVNTNLRGRLSFGDIRSSRSMTSPSRSVSPTSFLGRVPETVEDRLYRFAVPSEPSAGQVLFDPDLTIVVDGRLRVFLTDGSGRQFAVSYMKTPSALGMPGRRNDTSPSGSKP